jgi:transcriptional regulator with XRE-family HTH domain
MLNAEERLLRDLKDWCQNHRGGQKKLAKKLGVSESRFSHWLAGRRGIPLKFGLEILQFLEREKGKK